MKVVRTVLWKYTAINAYKRIGVKELMEKIATLLSILDDVKTGMISRRIYITSLTNKNDVLKNIIKEILEILQKAPDEHHFYFPHEEKHYIIEKTYAGKHFAVLRILEGTPRVITGVITNINIMCSDGIHSIGVELPLEREEEEKIPTLLIKYLEENNGENTTAYQILKQALED